MSLFLEFDSTAQFSDDQRYRYFLSRCWDITRPVALFIGLNPSTADATTDDPTIRRCVNFARTWGYGTLWMVNIFAYRSTDPKGLLSITDPIGPENDKWLEKSISEASLVVAAWGNQGNLQGRASEIMGRYISRLHALEITKTGMPKHPLYVRGDVKPVPILTTSRSVEPGPKLK